MFSNPGWFKSSTSTDVFPAPAQRQGWLFYGLWTTALAVPTVLLLGQSLMPEALIWLAVSALFYWFDLRKLRREIGEMQAFENLYFIDGSDPPLETENYVLEIKQ